MSLLGFLFERNKKDSAGSADGDDAAASHHGTDATQVGELSTDGSGDPPNLDRIREELDEIAKLIGPGDSYDMLADRASNVTTIDLPMSEIKTLIPNAFNSETAQDLPDDETATILVSDLFEQLQNGEVGTTAEQLLSDLDPDFLSDEFAQIKKNRVALPLHLVVSSLRPEELSKRTTKVERDPDLMNMPDVFSAGSAPGSDGQIEVDEPESKEQPEASIAPPEPESKEEPEAPIASPEAEKPEEPASEIPLQVESADLGADEIEAEDDVSSETADEESSDTSSPRPISFKPSISEPEPETEPEGEDKPAEPSEPAEPTAEENVAAPAEETASEEPAAHIPTIDEAETDQPSAPMSPFAADLDSMPNLFGAPSAEEEKPAEPESESESETPSVDAPPVDEPKEETAATEGPSEEPETSEVPTDEPSEPPRKEVAGTSASFDIPESISLPPREEESESAEAASAGTPSMDELQEMMKQAETSHGVSPAASADAQPTSEPERSPAAPESGTSEQGVIIQGIDINTADAETLVSRLDGIGSKLAVRIIEDREINGRFRDIYDIARVQGIGQKMFESMTGAVWREDLCGRREILANILDSSKDSIPDIKGVANRVAETKGFDGCVIAHSDGYVLASTWQHEKNDALGAFAPQMFKKVVQYIRRLEMGDMDAFTFFFEAYPVTLVNSGPIYLAAIHTQNRFSRRHVQIARALTVELDHRLMRMREG